jgi:hypothetical protein
MGVWHCGSMCVGGEDRESLVAVDMIAEAQGR